jgi:hypothetical protein
VKFFAFVLEFHVQIRPDEGHDLLRHLEGAFPLEETTQNPEKLVNVLMCVPDHEEQQIRTRKLVPGHEVR